MIFLVVFPARLCYPIAMMNPQNALNHAYAAFDYASDPELTEACIFEISSLKAKMNYLVRQIKELEVCAATAVSASVYTQVSDVEDEINGLLTFDRKACKVDVDRVMKINRRLRF